jgi:hypothetical protein
MDEVVEEKEENKKPASGSEAGSEIDRSLETHLQPYRFTRRATTNQGSNACVSSWCECIAIGNQCQFWLSSDVLRNRYSLLLISWLAASCESVPGYPDTSTADYRLRGLQITPTQITFTPADGVRDTMIAVEVRVAIESVAGKPGRPTVFVGGIETPMGQDPLTAGQALATVRIPTATTDLSRFDLTVIVVDGGRAASNRVSGTVHVTGFSTGNPVIVSVLSPDTVRIPTAPSSFLLRVSMSHPNGRNQIDLVQADIRNPDGSLLSGSPFRLFDDGNVPNSGDQTANDGIYTRAFQITPSNQPAVYTVTYTARDRFGNDATPVVRQLVFAP